ncbi:surface-adhesin E family protein [Polynucleobacter sp.]|uniref:surface-adhesin E family protein n=1 Tax=Polynucleobacter sp. TaxID=2029855 RepID=UPI0033420A0B
MKKSIAHLSIAVLSLSLTGNVLAAWQEIGQNEQTVVLVDVTTLKLDGDKAQIMSMLSFKKTGKDPKTDEFVNSIVGLNEYDCSSVQYRPLEVKMYPSRDGKDLKVPPTVVKKPYIFESVKTPDSAFEPVENGSWAAGVFNVACRSK